MNIFIFIWLGLTPSLLEHPEGLPRASRRETRSLLPVNERALLSCSSTSGGKLRNKSKLFLGLCQLLGLPTCGVGARATLLYFYKSYHSQFMSLALCFRF